jgi:surface antigen
MLLLASMPAVAQPADGSPRYWFLDRLAATDLVPADWELLRQNIQMALYELEDGETVTWTEPASEHSGSVRVLGTAGDATQTCRRLRVSIDVDAGSDDGVFQLCRKADGFWVLVTSTMALHD